MSLWRAYCLQLGEPPLFDSPELAGKLTPLLLQIFPFIAQQLWEMGVTDKQEKLGYYAGVIVRL